MSKNSITWIFVQFTSSEPSVLSIFVYKMKLFVVAMFLTATAVAIPTISPETAALRKLPAVQREEIRDEFGQYAYRYVTAEGAIVYEQGRLVPSLDGEGHVMVVEGETTFIGDDGKKYVTKYSAGIGGTKAEGSHLPVPVLGEPASQ